MEREDIENVGLEENITYEMDEDLMEENSYLSEDITIQSNANTPTACIEEVYSEPEINYADIYKEPVMEPVMEPVTIIELPPTLEMNIYPIVHLPPESPPTPPTPLSSTSSIFNVPEIIFIIPYRDRELHKKFFIKQMNYVLEDYDKKSYEIWFIHQKDTRNFNRGALKNIGFLYAKEKYPNDYQKITLVFNDIDTMPIDKNIFDYKTVHGVVKHFYGFTHALGGIVSITAGDFEKIGGFPNYWAWGYEDNSLQIRVLKHKLTINRTNFRVIHHRDVIYLNDGLTRQINKQEFLKYTRNDIEGHSNIFNIKKTIEYELSYENIWMIHINEFITATSPNNVYNEIYDLNNGPRPYNKYNKKNGMLGQLYSNSNSNSNNNNNNNNNNMGIQENRIINQGLPPNSSIEAQSSTLIKRNIPRIRMFI